MTKRYTKYNNQNTNGYDSKKESKRAWELQMLQRAGKISDLQEQVWIELQEAFTYDGKKEQAIHYVADFVFQENGREVVEDVKGMKTEAYKLKRKMLLKRYPEILFRET